MLWKKLNRLSGRISLPVPYSEIFAVQIPKTDTRWLVGPYEILTGLATALRSDEDLRDQLTDLGVRIGLRSTDTPSTEERQVRFGKTKKGVADDFSFLKMRKEQLAESLSGGPAAVNRRTDRQKNVLGFWQTQTPQSHHIVEYNNLRDIGESDADGKGKRDMDYNQLPAVLLAAEFHQRYISVFLKQAHGMTKAELQKRMPVMYRSLYVEHSALFEPLWRISKVILAEAGLRVA